MNTLEVTILILNLGNPILRGRIRSILHVEDIALQSKPYSGYDISSSNLFGCLGI
ncbi:hypothetical protein C1646_696227 [Rhizophagus diaphanus]|nr:hypothetical protein C1646_696227 [Rhizophagus diaphanus] [Rhizophagus sp. MUCL 43196]